MVLLKGLSDNLILLKNGSKFHYLGHVHFPRLRIDNAKQSELQGRQVDYR